MCYELACVQSCDAFDAALEKGDIDVVLAGYESPGFAGFSALELTKKVLPGAPFIFISGTPDEEAAQRDEENRVMFEFASIGHARIDLRTGRLLRVNPKLCRITGYSEAELPDVQVFMRA